LEGQVSDLAAQLQSLGAVPIVAPAIQLVATADSSARLRAIEDLDSYDWIIFTSPTAVEFFWSLAADKLAQIGSSRTRFAAVGPATKAALQAHGISVDAMPDEYLGVNIAATLGNVQGKRILLPRSAQGGRELPAALVDSGATVEEIALYSPAPVAIDEAARSKMAAGTDIVTFASGSAVRAFVAALRQDPRFNTFWPSVVVACIGPTTAEVARSEGLPIHVVAPEHSASGLVAALVAYYEQGA
jgi:uroporphyrinogen-III synthase